jgi:RHS repeat-associated protein
VVALRSKTIPSGDTDAPIAWEFYLHGAEREARLTKLDVNPQFGAAEVSFYLNDHLGNTRVNYTPVEIVVPASSIVQFDDNFDPNGSNNNWTAVTISTSVIIGSSLVATNYSSAPSIQKPFAFSVANSYEVTVFVDFIASNGGVQLQCSGNTYTLLSGQLNTFSFQGTDNINGLTISGTGLSTFSMKNIKLTEINPGGSTLLQQINAVMDYFPYGKVLREYTYSNGKERYLTTQHERDAETGLDYRGARYYDSDVARFLSTDPWQDKYPAWSTYNYVMGNPIIYTDPTGKGVEGDYYNGAKYLGNDGKDDKKVYQIDEKDIKYKNITGTTSEGKEVVLGRKVDFEKSKSQYLGQVTDVFNTGDSPTDKNIQSLNPAIRMMAKNFIIEANKSSGDTKIRIAQGHRTYAEQDALYAKGRTAPGSIVTKARGGYSNHNFGLAFDIVGITNGKVDYNLDWTKLSGIGKSNGFDWGGDWKSFQDKPHFENLFGNSLKQLRNM